LELLERETDLARLEEHFRQAAAGHGRLVLVGGEAGIGKTALVDAFCRGIAEEVTVLRAWCDALSTPAPLGPVRDLAPQLGLTIDDHPLDHDAHERLFRETLAAFAARPGPAVVIAEDAHWADGATLDLLRFLSRRIGGLRTLVVVTYRDDEIGPNHPLRLLLGDLTTAPAVQRMTLLPLSEEAVQRLTAGTGRDIAGLHRLTGGNPFFLTEVLATAGERVPASVGDAVLARTARLSLEARAVLDVAAVIGSTVDVALLQRVAGPVLDEADECIARGMLRSTADGLAFRHALAREAIFGAIAPTRRRLLHARVLEALREESEADPDLALLAHHAEEAGDRQAVLEFSIPAAEQATALHAHREAVGQYERALRFGDALPTADRARLHEGRALACYMTDQGEEAIVARREALALWHEVGDPFKQGENLRWLARLCWLQGRAPEAEAAAIAALELLEPLPAGPELARVYNTRAQIRMLDNDLDETLRWAKRAVALAEDIAETETLAHALTTIGSVQDLFELGHGEEELTRGLRLALDFGFHEVAGRALTNLAWSTMWAMRLDDAERRFATALAFTIEHDQDYRRGYLLAGQATLQLLQGTWAEAEAACHLLLRQPILGSITRTVVLTTWGQLCARRGLAEAAPVLNEALALAERSRQLMRLGPVRAARAEAALLAGNAAQALAEVQGVREIVFTRGSRWLRGEFAWLLWQAGERDVPSNLDDLAEPFARQIAGDWSGAAAAWRELGCPYEEAGALAASDDPAMVRHAVETYERLGAQPALQQAVSRLRVLGVRDLPPVRRGPRPATSANPAGLTPREVEVLALVAQGLRNAEIAERLYMTPKTVSHHITAILAKLGVSSRTEAAHAATKLGITSPI
jgi:predicted ATPase/DNA-binding CsgD family transcriptional regulator